MKAGSLFLFSLLLASSMALADDAITGLQDKPQFQAMKSEVAQAFDKHDDKYKELTPEDQKKVLDTLDRMAHRWAKAESLAGLSPNDRTEMANDQEVVTTLLTHASAESRLVCERVIPIGSNLPKRVCKTVAQRNRETIQAQESQRSNSVIAK